MGYDYLPLPQPTTGIPDAIGSYAHGEIAKLEELGRNTGKDFEYIPTLKAMAEQVSRIEDSVNATQLNSQIVSSKFPISGQDQNMQRSWNAFSFNANWVNANGATNPTQSRKTSENVVYVQGYVKNTAGFAYGGVNSAIGTLAAGNRPVSQAQRVMLELYDAGYANYLMGIIDITTAGVCSINGAVPIPAGGGTGAINSTIAFFFSFWAV